MTRLKNLTFRSSSRPPFHLFVLLAFAGIAFLCFFAMLSCVPVSKTPDPSRFFKDDLFCWMKSSNGKWYTKGLPENCPEGTLYR